jgi:TPR repeat protein
MDMELSALSARAREAGLNEQLVDCAERGQADAQFDLGRCYQDGAGVERDLAEAGAWYNKAYGRSNVAVTRSVADAQSRCAINEAAARTLNTLYDDCSDDDTETVETVALYRKGAEQGLASAQYHLGRCYQYGRGVERDLVEAGAWYRKAIKGNLSGLQTSLRDYDWEDKLNTLYDDCPDDDTETVETVALHRKGAEQGLASAQYHLGRCYQYGRGVERDLVEAGAWYRKAIDAGIGWRVDDNLNTLYDDCSDDDTETVETVALYRKGAEQGLGSAQYHLGRCYQYGAGVERDLVEAGAWYQKAAEQRIFNAAYELGVMYANGRGVPKDDAEAVLWYRFAAGQGHHAKAEHNLKVMYADGRAVPEDEDEDVWKSDDASGDF